MDQRNKTNRGGRAKLPVLKAVGVEEERDVWGIVNSYPFTKKATRRQRNAMASAVGRHDDAWVVKGDEIANNWDESQEIDQRFKHHPAVLPLILTRGGIHVGPDGRRYYRTEDRVITKEEDTIYPKQTPFTGFWTLDGVPLKFEQIRRFEMRRDSSGIYRIWVDVDINVPKLMSPPRQHIHRSGWYPLNYWFQTEKDIRQALAKIKETQGPLFEKRAPLTQEEREALAEERARREAHAREVELAFYGDEDNLD